MLVLQLRLQGGGTRDADVHSDDVIRTTSHKVLPTYGKTKSSLDPACNKYCLLKIIMKLNVPYYIKNFDEAKDRFVSNI